MIAFEPIESELILSIAASLSPRHRAALLKRVRAALAHDELNGSCDSSIARALMLAHAIARAV